MKTKNVRISDIDPSDSNIGADAGVIFFLGLFLWPLVLPFTMPGTKSKLITFLISTPLAFLSYVYDFYLTAGFIATLVAMFVYLFKS